MAHEISAGFVHSNTGSVLVVFFFFLRKSNLTAPSACAFDPSKHLSHNGAVQRTRWSKTLKHEEGILLIPLPLTPSSNLFPVTAIHHYFQLAWFCVQQRPQLQPITSFLFSSFLKDTITAIGLNATNFSPHSFHRGGTTHAYQSGVPDHLIKLHGTGTRTLIVQEHMSDK